MILFQDGILATMILKLYPLIPTPGNNKVQAPLNANKNVTREQFLKFVMILQRKQKQRQQQQRQQQTEIEQKQTEKNDTFNDDVGVPFKFMDHGDLVRLLFGVAVK